MTLTTFLRFCSSRRQFCEDGFWLMTSTFDLQSFIQTVVLEEAHLEDDQTLGGPNSAPDGDAGPAHARPVQLTRARKSQRQLAFVSPRLGVLNNIPFVIPFDQRVAIFRTFVENDRKRLGIERYQFSRRHRHRAVVRRGHIAEDGFAHLNGLGPALKDTIEIAFIDQHGLEEAGIDGGGVFKEFLTSLSKEAFDNDRGLWLATQQQELYPNPHSYSRESSQLSWYGFLGRILGKALYEGILVDIAFAGAFLSKWLGKQSYLDDLASVDPELYQGLLFLKNYTGNVEGDLSLNFTVANEEFGVSKTLDLIPNGRNVAVTNENRVQYITLVAHYRLNVQTEKQCAAFFGGLSDIIEPGWIRMFNQQELRVLVGGTDQELDVDDLASNCVYGGWDESHDTVRAVRPSPLGSRAIAHIPYAPSSGASSSLSTTRTAASCSSSARLARDPLFSVSASSTLLSRSATRAPTSHVYRAPRRASTYSSCPHTIAKTCFERSCSMRSTPGLASISREGSPPSGPVFVPQFVCIDCRRR